MEELSMMDCVLPFTWAVGISTVVWLFRKGNVENAAKVGGAEESRLLPTADQAFNLMKCRRSVSPKDYVTGGSVPEQDLHRVAIQQHFLARKIALTSA